MAKKEQGCLESSASKKESPKAHRPSGLTRMEQHMNTQRVLGCSVTQAQSEYVKEQLRQRAARENRAITISDAVREALRLYGIRLSPDDAGQKNG